MGVRYAVVIERGEENFSAYVPDLPGCVGTGRTLDEVRVNIRQAIDLHVKGMIEDGDAVPVPTTACEYVESRMA